MGRNTGKERTEGSTGYKRAGYERVEAWADACKEKSEERSRYNVDLTQVKGRMSVLTVCVKYIASTHPEGSETWTLDRASTLTLTNSN